MNRKRKALILTDLQNDFLPNGALAVPRGHEIIPLANILQEYFEIVIATQDWHPATHASFHSLWPNHCIQHSHGAKLASALRTEKISKIIYKGTHPDIDSYSVFFDNNHEYKTELDDYLKSQHITELYFMGLATDYCVKYSVLDALSLGYTTFLIEDGCRGIDLKPGDVKKAIKEMQKQGAKIIQSSHVLQGKLPAKSRTK